MTQIYEAQYTPASLKSHRANPLIEALPDYVDWNPREIMVKLFKKPEPTDVQATRRQLIAWLQELPANLFIPTKRQYTAFLTIDLLIRQGYVLRNPLTALRARYLKESYARLQQGEKVLESTFEEEVHEQLTACIIGASGMGKTRTVERILSLYPQLIMHRREMLGSPFLQIVYLHVECPDNGSVIALCKNILAEIDRLTGEDYRTKFKITDRTTLETLKSTLVHVLALHYVGIIVIDEVQNLAAKTKNREDLFNFIVSLSNSLNVPLLFLCTPKIYGFLTSNARTARRFGTRGCMVWSPLKKDSSEWETIRKELWKCSKLQQDPPEIPAMIENSLYEKSGGIIEILLKLFILAQVRVLIVSAHKDKPCEQKLTTLVIEQVFEEFFQNMKPILRLLANADLPALQKLEDLVIPDDMVRMVQQIRQESNPGPEALRGSEDQRDWDASETLRGGLQFAGEDLPDIVRDIGQKFMTSQQG